MNKACECEGKHIVVNRAKFKIEKEVCETRGLDFQKPEILCMNSHCK